jgi:hypothetical protein
MSAGIASATGPYYWSVPGSNYNGGNPATQNCWSPANDNDTLDCDNVGANYIFSHYLATENPPGQSLTWPVSQNGDYSTTWTSGTEAQLNASDPWSLAPYSGYTPPSPIGDYQIANSTNESTANQAYGQHWGWWINSTDAGNTCVTSVCNSYHFLYLWNTADYPFALEFTDSGLVMSYTLHIQQVDQGTGQAYATMEPYLLDTTTNQIIDTMINTWDTGFPNGNGVPYATAAGEYGAEFNPVTMNGVTYHGFYNVTYDKPGTTFTTQVSGTTCQACGAPYNGSFTTNTTYQDLKNQVAWDNAAIARGAPGTAGMVPYSTLARNYRLIYIIDGGEMNTTTFGGYDTAPTVYTTSS